MSSMGRSCVDTIRRSRQNVAIATQVLSPSAIGGSLRGQRRLKHFGPPDDDEEEFIAFRRRAALKKLGYYGLAITVTIIVLMGTILAVGYLQTKKSTSNMVASRSVKLIQDDTPSAYIYSGQTTSEPPSLEPTTDSLEFSPTSHTSFLRSYTKEDSDEQRENGSHLEDEIYFSSSGESEPIKTYSNDDEYLSAYNLEDDQVVKQTDVEAGGKTDTRHQPLFFITSENDNVENDDEVKAFDDTVKKENDANSVNTLVYEKIDNVLLNAIIPEKESVRNDEDIERNDWKSHSIVDSSPKANESKLPTKEKVNGLLSLDSDDSVFSVEIPIYSTNKSSVEFVDAVKNDFTGKREADDLLVPVVLLDVKNENVANNTVEDDEGSEENTENDDDNSDSVDVYLPKNKSEATENEGFHHTILHTALFHLDEERREAKTSKPAATKIIIEDQDSEDSTEQYISNRSGGRNHKVKILQNDKVMNMKATYSPDRTKQQRITSLLRDSGENIDASNSENVARKQTFRAKQRNENEENKNKTSGEWKLKLRVNNEESKKSNKILKGGLSPEKGTLKQSTSLLDQIKLSSLSPAYGHASEETGTSAEEKPRSLSTSILPNFESFLKNILTNVQQMNTKKGNSNAPFHNDEQASPFGLGYANNLDHLLPASTLPSPATLDLDPAHFRKRTYISEHDKFDFPSPIQAASLPQADNYFDRLLGQIPSVGSIGSPSTTGATLINYPSFTVSPTPSISTFPQYENIHSSSTSDTPHLAPGVIPLDLASSFIPAGFPQRSYFPQAQASQNSPSFGDQNSYGNLFGGLPPLSLSNSPSKGLSNGGLGDVGTLTTAGGQPPTYNSISQGIHLLNMISGTLPNSYFHDQVYHASATTAPTFQSDIPSSPPSFQFNNPLANNNFHVSATSNEYNSNLAALSALPHPASVLPFPSLQSSYNFRPEPTSNPVNTGTGTGVTQGKVSANAPFISRALPLKSDREAVEKFLEEDDQVPAASSSITHSVYTTYKEPKNKVKSTMDVPVLPTTEGSIITLMTKPRTRTTNMFKNLPQKNHSSPKSFSFEILPHKNPTSPNLLPPSSNSLFFDNGNSLGLTNDDMDTSYEDISRSRSKKKSSASLSQKWKNSGDPTKSEHIKADLIGSRKPPLKSMHTQSIKNTVNAAGLKSGFFT